MSGQSSAGLHRAIAPNAGMKAVLDQLFRETLAELSLDRVIPQKVTHRNGILRIVGKQGEESAGRIEVVDLREFAKDETAKIIVAAIGKAAFPMAEKMAEILKPFAVSGIVVHPSDQAVALPGFLSFAGGHPEPNEDSLRAAGAILEMLSHRKPSELVIYLLSGGGSAMCEKPISAGISLNDLREFYRVLVTCGANIVEINTLRKHLSVIKGGKLSELACPAQQITLYVSDVPPDKPWAVASGPTRPDPSTIDDCHDIAKRFGLLRIFPESIRRIFEQRSIPETPKGGRAFEDEPWHCLLDNRDAVTLLESKARGLGWIVLSDSEADEWPVSKAVDHLLAKLEDLRARNPGRIACVVAGGEHSCPVPKDAGFGGRNQAFVLHCARKIAGQNMAVLSAGTDGDDGKHHPSKKAAAGAVADGETSERALALEMDVGTYLERFNSYEFFERLDDLVITGLTGNNIRDVRIMVSY